MNFVVQFEYFITLSYNIVYCVFIMKIRACKGRGVQQQSGQCHAGERFQKRRRGRSAPGKPTRVRGHLAGHVQSGYSHCSHQLQPEAQAAGSFCERG